jgi:peptidyl-prolyl cis-trans isomerase B (cyclophilin B)
MKKILLPFILILFIFSSVSAQNDSIFTISTKFGNIKIKLYSDTPQHKANFIKLVKEGFYNGSIFHRVIKTFMIQGGGAAGGTADVGYTVPAEILPKYFHKKGALAAARMPDQINPTKASSGSQFYLVQGKVYTDAELDNIEKSLNRKFSAEQRKLYKTIGGTPFLDGNYTVFGEVIQGLDVIDKIAAVITGAADKPLEDVTMTISASN